MEWHTKHTSSQFLINWSPHDYSYRCYIDIYNKFRKTSNSIDESLAKEEYEDAFDHVEYLDEIGLANDVDIEEMTEELYPGIRKLKKSAE